MTAPVTVEEERSQEEEAQPPAFEGDGLEAVRAYMLQLLTESGYSARALTPRRRSGAP
jgi:transposase